MNSDSVKKGWERAPHRALLRATGIQPEDFNKPFIGVCNSYTQVIPGHVHLDKVAAYIKKYIKKAGGVPIVAIGGITLERLDEVISAGCSRVAVSSAIIAAADVVATTREFKEKLKAAKA